MMTRTVALIALLTCSLPALAAAAERSGPAEVVSPAPLVPPQPPAPATDAGAALLPGLYAGYVGLQIMDVRSTSAALANGAHEANPLMAPFAGSQAAMLGVKAAATAGTIYLSSRIARRNRAAAIVTMAALNGLTAAVVARNMQHAR